MVMICETLATESLGRPVLFLGRITFPGASARRRLLVMTTTTVVAIWLALKASFWTTRTGRRKPGPEPPGSARDAHQISPRFTTPPEAGLRVAWQPVRDQRRCSRGHGFCSILP